MDHGEDMKTSDIILELIKERNQAEKERDEACEEVKRLERELNIVTEERDGAILKCQRIAGEMLARLAGA